MSERFGKYELGPRIGEGGTAEVFLARLSGFDGFQKNVALKLVLPELMREREFLQLFVAEAKLVSVLTHPNIAQVYELGSANDRYFIAMEYVSGLDLGAARDLLLQRGERWPVAAVIAIALDVLAALAYAHEKRDATGISLGIVHRDVSPQNILLSREGAVKLVDFGIAKAEGRAFKTRSGVLRGKFAYMAPEQAAGGWVDARADVFALALIMYELLAGRPAYVGGDAEVLEQAGRAEIAPLAGQDVPRALSDVLSRALARQASDRFDDARAFAQALRAAAPLPFDAVSRANLWASWASPAPQMPELPKLASPRRPIAIALTALGLVATVVIFWRPRPAPIPVLAPVATVALPASAPASAPVIAPVGNGFLNVNSRPWSHVFVDDKAQSDTPLRRLSLPVGAHQVHLVCPQLSRSIDLPVQIERDKTTVKLVTDWPKK